jgi:hypothetical protein
LAVRQFVAILKPIFSGGATTSFLPINPQPQETTTSTKPTQQTRNNSCRTGKSAKNSPALVSQNGNTPPPRRFVVYLFVLNFGEGVFTDRE